jgi:hypothetical protein
MPSAADLRWSFLGEATLAVAIDKSIAEAATTMAGLP